MTPTGIVLLTLFFFLLVAVIAFGAAWIKNGEARAREERRQLKEMVAAKKKAQE